MQRASRLLPLCMLLTTAILILLTAAGLVSAVRKDGRLPHVSIEYASDHWPLLSPVNVEEGLVDLTIAAQLDFDSPDASSRLVQAAEQTQNADALVIALQGFLANDGDDPELHSWMAAALLAAGDSQRALVHSRESLRLAPDSPDRLVTHGNVLVSLGRADEARRTYERALELEPESALANQGLERLRQQRGRRQ